ncbi:MerR family transcriptional regulator [Trinickia dabaoshanensis]|uniref:MerR family transcriptional regulator n=1 Tax=Trinickia dabaoshanensis TaxID=564714 RepID=A0A2N7VLF4_9BURK|nr:MerR family transcriptional regulator [Trinickia dabaoshanensis]PMS17966.1 MerR family transcriptional regulator [Trinickia dabaoshanensis]
MSEALTIGRMAEALGVSTHTLRYYEQAGLIRPVSRSQAGHRLYSRADIEWLRLVMRLRATGMPIARIQAIAELRAEGPATANERRALLLEHRDAVQAELRQWQANLAAIEQKIRDYDAMLSDMTDDKNNPQPSKERSWQSTRTQTTNATRVDGQS